MGSIFKKISSKSGGAQPPLILVPKIQGGLRPPNPPYFGAPDWSKFHLRQLLRGQPSYV